MRDWYIAAVAAEYFSHFGSLVNEEGPATEENTLSAYTYHESWSLLIDALVDAADDLVHAVRDAIARDVEVDSYKTLSEFVNRLLVEAAHQAHWPYDSDVRFIAKESIQE
jgi:hypothetical protein